jgi:hypothetical protein
VNELPAGLAMLTAHDLDDRVSARTRTYLPRFRAAPAPDPGSGAGVGDWAAWEKLLAARDHAPDADAGEAMTVVTDFGFGTLSSSLIALPGIDLARIDQKDARTIYRFAAGRPGEAAYRAVSD